MSEARFVCAVIRDRAGRILLERRSRNVGHFAGLWCTPGGAIDDGETPEEAIRREIREETGLELSALTRMRDVVRCSGTIAFFASEPGDYAPYVLEPAFIDELAWFHLDDLPERMVLESVLGLAAELNDQPLATVVDRTFSALFYGHMEPSLEATWPSDAASCPLFHTIRRTPWRKFHAAVPLLASRAGTDALLPSLAAEVLFCFFYVHDDLLDGKTTRYGRQTALGALGREAAMTFASSFQHSLQTWLKKWPLTPARRTIEASAAAWIAALVRYQCERLDGRVATMDAYEGASAARTAFLGRLWEIAADSIHNPALSNLWREIYPLCAVVGQLKNDLRELDPASESYQEDMRAGTTTAVTMMLRARGASVTDRVAAAAVRAEITSRCETLISNVIDAIRRSSIDDDVRVVLEAWLHMQFENGLLVGAAVTNRSAGSFLAAVARIAERLDFSVTRQTSAL